MNNFKISAVIVTYNRKELLKECIISLLRQTKKLDNIIIIDNNSTDGTGELIRSEFKNLSYIKLYENLGGAGGFYEGIKIAYKNGYDWIWAMDDDAEPKNNALEKLISSSFINQKSTGALLSLLVNENNKIDNRSIEAIEGVEKTFKNKKLDIRNQIKINKEIKISSYPLVGVLVSHRAIKKIGYPNPKFFIQCDDIEFLLRVSDHYNIFIIPDSKIIHKNQEDFEGKRKLIFNKSLRLLSFSQLWKHYYGKRNFWYIAKKRLSVGKLLSLIVKDFLFDFTSIFFHKDHKYLRVKIYFEALLDGIFGRLGKKYLPDSFKTTKN